MVFFHSYVRLPEGRWFSELFYKPQLSSGMTDWISWIQIPTWGWLSHSNPNLWRNVPFNPQVIGNFHWFSIYLMILLYFQWDYPTCLIRLSIIIYISIDIPIISHLQKKYYPIYVHLISPYFNSQILPKKVRLDPLGMIPLFFAQFPSPIFGIHQTIVIFCWLWSFYPTFQLYE